MTIKLLSAGFIVAAILAGPVSAHEYYGVAGRGAETAHASGSPIAHSSDGLRWGPANGVMSETPTDQPGGICDHGDDPQIC
ncbi:hypothetical protein [Bradyrhizobium erythrophlei]|uniref:Uncharacterized protein n=1 Tax=Bradyrhizobium erythrophlei TaxID=1437360 RepID=A0A1H5GEA0_9BRAD|nr:hypothetical protein [Bradyrhizobium erythrophlei]SEE14066.1 hypothetical protein SAMN05444164_7058 [Bradyrhizobium erythrophlei]